MTTERWKQIEEVYYRAKEHDAGARPAFLDEACGADEELRRQVESLLTSDDEAEDFLEAPAMDLAAQMIADDQPPSLAGKQIGHYEILAQIGAGGMGEVYRARDTRLGREVAVKVLPAHLSQDREALARFEREAKAVATLSHPNILAIHDFGTEQGVCYAVTELLEGETLGTRLSRSALRWREAVEIGVAIADGLSAAHAKGVIHRDLKPENIFLIADGRVKILDFGLARMKAAGSVMDESTASAHSMTEPGAVMGTVSYMSPEQVRGEKVDTPSDIFSLGCVLHEMVTGQRTFRRQTAAETMAAILRDEPQRLSDFAKDVPTELDLIVSHCLEKKAEDRFHSARDLSFALRALLSGSKLAITALLPKPRIQAARWRWATLAVVIAVLVLAVLYFRSAPSDRGSIGFTIPLPGTWIATELENQFLAVSPDGQRLAFVVESEGQRMLWLRPRDSTSAKALAGTDGAASPFWSPDSRWIAFFAEGKLKKVDPSGGPPQTLCSLPMRAGTGTWSRDGTVLIAGQGGGNEGIYRVSEAGDVALVLKPDRTRGEVFLFWPHFLPDGRHFFFLNSDGQSKGHAVFIGSLDTGQSRQLLENSSRVEYVPPGYLLYVREGTLLAHPFDATELKFTGEPIAVAEQVQYFHPTGYADFSASEGLLAYRAGVIASRLVWFDRNGRDVGVVGQAGQYEEPRLSPDEKKVAVGLVDPRSGALDLWVLDLKRGLASRVTSLPTTEYGPVWSPDGRYLAFAADADGPPHVYRKNASGAGGAEMLIPPGEVQWVDDWSSDGRFIVYAEAGAKTGLDLWILPLFGDPKPYPFLTTPFNEKEARFSPDGRWVAYVSDESGKNEVYVQPLRKSGEKWRISTSGGSQPVWRLDGKELFYLAADNRLVAVPVKSEAGFEAGVPAMLFRIDPAPEHAYDVTADGQRFLVNTNVTRIESLPITAVVNWTVGLKK